MTVHESIDDAFRAMSGYISQLEKDLAASVAQIQSQKELADMACTHADEAGTREYKATQALRDMIGKLEEELRIALETSASQQRVAIAMQSQRDKAEQERDALRSEMKAIEDYARKPSSDKVQLFNMLTSIANTCANALKATP